MRSSKFVRGIGSGTVVTLALAGVAIGLVALGRVVGWDATWRAFGITPLQPTFFDMHVINDCAACARKGLDVYAPHACNGDNFNIPPTWLWLGFFGIDGADSSWLSAVINRRDLDRDGAVVSGAPLVPRRDCACCDHFPIGDDGCRARQSWHS